MTVIFSHVRKLSIDKRYAECIANLDDKQTRDLDDFLAEIRGHGSSSSAPPSKQTRTLKAEPTLDDEGYPAMFNDMDSQIQEQQSDTEDAPLTSTCWSSDRVVSASVVGVVVVVIVVLAQW